VPVPILEQALRGQLQLGAEGKTITDPKLGPLYWSSDRGVISYPYKSLTLWFLVESLRWKFYPGTLDNLEEATAINNRAVRERSLASSRQRTWHSGERHPTQHKPWQRGVF